jgi:hypothetical protein
MTHHWYARRYHPLNYLGDSPTFQLDGPRPTFLHQSPGVP